MSQKMTLSDRKITRKSDPGSLVGKSLEIRRTVALPGLVGAPAIPAVFELYCDGALLATCPLAAPLEQWAFRYGCEKVVTLPQSDFNWGQEI